MDGMLEILATWMPELLRTSLQAALLVAVIVTVQWIFAKRLSPAWRHALWGLLIVRLLLVWAPPSPLSVYNLAPREVSVAVLELPEHTEITKKGAVPASSENGLASAFRDGRDFSDGRESNENGGRGSVLSGVDYRAAASLVWLGAFGALLLAMAGQSLHFGRQVRRGRIVTDSGTLELLEECRANLRVSPFLALVETDCVRSPALLGCIRPKLLLPCGFLDTLSREEMRHVFLHELAHVKRGDIWSGWLFNLLVAAHWFNPAIWFARRRFIADREAACDAHVLAALDATDQRGYGHTVLNLNQRFNTSPWAPGMAGISESNSNLKRRITMIKQFRPPTRLAAWSGAGLCVCIGLATLTNAQDVKPEAAGDIVCEISDVYGYTATNGGTMIAAQLTNTGARDVTVEVEFWSGGMDTGTKIGRGGLVVPAGKTATEAIPWAVENGTHAIAVWVDPDNAVVESDEENNRIAATIEYTNGRFRQGGVESSDAQVDPDVVDEAKKAMAVIEELQKEPGESIYEFGIETKVNADPRVGVLQVEIAKLDTEVDLMRLTHLDGHPDRRAAEVKLGVLQNRLEKQSASIREGELAALRAKLTEQLGMKFDQNPPVGAAVKRATLAPGQEIRDGENWLVTDENGVIVERPSVAMSDDYIAGADSAEDLKYLGTVFKMFSMENRGGAYPPLSREPGRLMFAWEGDGRPLDSEKTMSVEYLTDLSIVGCKGCDIGSALPDDNAFVYLGHAVGNDEHVRRFAEAYKGWSGSDDVTESWFSDNKRRSPEEGVARLCNGVWEFLITDFNDPGADALAQSKLPVLIEWPDRAVDGSGKQGGSVLYMDGHVEFVNYPGRWPMTEVTMNILCELAGRRPIMTLE